MSETKPRGVTLDFNSHTWRAGRKTMKIGEGRALPKWPRTMVLGVFNRNNIRHLDRLAELVAEQQDDDSHPISAEAAFRAFMGTRSE